MAMRILSDVRGLSMLREHWWLCHWWNSPSCWGEVAMKPWWRGRLNKNEQNYCHSDHRKEENVEVKYGTSGNIGGTAPVWNEGLWKYWFLVRKVHPWLVRYSFLAFTVEATHGNCGDSGDDESELYVLEGGWGVVSIVISRQICEELSF